MNRNAIGLIETRGLVAAVEAVDACLKAANVEFMSFRFTTGGLVCVLVNGDVGAVRAAIDAGSAAAERVGEVVGVHVIPRPADDIMNIIEQIDVGVKEPKQNGASLEGLDVKSSIFSEEHGDSEELLAPEDLEPEVEVEDDLKVDNEDEDQVEAIVESEVEAKVEAIVEKEDEIIDEDEDENDKKNEKDDFYSDEELYIAAEKLRKILAETQDDLDLQEGIGLDKYRVKVLRKIIRMLPIEDFDKSQVSSMRKRELLEAIMDFIAKEGSSLSDEN
jgi:ethanolamine utilization protein EutM